MHLLFLLISILPLSALNDDLTKSYLVEKSIKEATIIGCLTKADLIATAKQFMFATEKLTILNFISHPNFAHNLQTNYSRLGVIFDAGCPNSTQFLLECGELNLFDAKHHWLIQAPDQTILQVLKRVTLNINANLEVAIPDDDTFTIFDVYNPAKRHGGLLNATKLGFYSRQAGYQARRVQAKYWLRRNMTGVAFKSIIVLPVAFEGSLAAYLRNDENRDVNTFNRFHSRLVHSCRDYYNFSMAIRVEKSWGYTNSNGSFDGLVGALERREVDFGNSPLFVREDRARVIEYGRLTWILRASFLFRNPPTPGSFTVFLRPLSTPIWLITACLGALSAFILKLVASFERTEASWSVSALLTLGAFCQQGAPQTPSTTCGRIATIFTFLLSVIVYQFYSASIVSNLLMRPTTTIKSLRDLLESTLGVGCEDILYTRDFLQHTNDGVTRALYERKILAGGNGTGFLAPEEGLRRVEAGGFAFHVEVDTAYPMIEHDFRPKLVCELREVQLFRIQPMHANYQKESPFRDMLDTCLQRLGESGILQRERTHWHPRKPECLQTADTSNFNVGLDQFYPVLVILFVGIFSSLIVLVGELQKKKWFDGTDQIRLVKRVVKIKDVIYPFVK